MYLDKNFQKNLTMMLNVDAYGCPVCYTIFEFYCSKDQCQNIIIDSSSIKQLCYTVRNKKSFATEGPSF